MEKISSTLVTLPVGLGENAELSNHPDVVVEVGVPTKQPHVGREALEASEAFREDGGQRVRTFDFGVAVEDGRRGGGVRILDFLTACLRQEGPDTKLDVERQITVDETSLVGRTQF
jgi:hypothetical protein